MSQEQAMRARVDGRTKTAARTVWSLEIGTLRARCLHQADGSYVVQGRVAGVWSETIGAGPNPLVLLRAVTASKGVAKALDPAG